MTGDLKTSSEITPRSIRRVVVALVLLAMCLACFGRLVIHPTDVLVGPQRGGETDLTNYFQPIRDFQVIAWWRHGSLPAWDHHLQMGHPFIGNPQPGVYYPANWLFLLLGTGHIVSWLMAAHHLLAGWGTYLLCRRYGFVWPAALLGGVIYMGAPFLIAQTAEGHWSQTCIAGWIPWAMLCYERLRRGRRNAVPLIGIVLALAFFCGHPQEVFYLVAILSAFWVTDLIKRSAGLLPASRLAWHWVAAGALTVMLVAIDLLPVYFMSKHSTRGEGQMTAAQVSQYASGPANLWQTFDPFVHGTPAEYWGPGLYWESLMYLGLVPLVCAAVGIAAAVRTYPVGRFTALLLLGMTFAMGASTPFYIVLHHFVPGVGMFRVPSRMMFFCSLAVAVLAAAGLNQLMRMAQTADNAARRRLRIGLAVGCGAAAVALVLALALPRPIAAPELASWRNVNFLHAASWIFAGTASLLLISLAGTRGQWVALLVVVAAGSELACHALAATRTVAASDWRRTSEITEFLSRQQGLFRVLGDQKLLSDDECWRHGIDRVRGYDPFLLKRYALVLQAAVDGRKFLPGEPPGFVTHPRLAYRRGVLDLTNTRFVLLPHHDELQQPGWKLVARGTIPQRITLRGAPAKELPYSIFENESVIPRAFVLGTTQPAGTGKQSVQRLARLDPREAVLVAEDVLPAEPRQLFRPAEVVNYAPTRVTVEATLSEPGYLVLTDIFAPGWTATVDAQRAALVPVNIGFRGVPLPPGKHTVVFHFQTPLWYAASLVTLLALVMTVYLLVKSLRQTT